MLWTDPKAEWQPLIELILPRVEELLVLGDYTPEARTGPVIRDDRWTKINIEFYSDPADGAFKALIE